MVRDIPGGQVRFRAIIDLRRRGTKGEESLVLFTFAQDIVQHGRLDTLVHDSSGYRLEGHQGRTRRAELGDLGKDHIRICLRRAHPAILLNSGVYHASRSSLRPALLQI